MRENDKKWQIMTKNGPRICFEIDVTPLYKLINLWNVQNNKNMSDCHYRINDEKWQKMTENDRKWHSNWLKMRQVIKTQLKELKKQSK